MNAIIVASKDYRQLAGLAAKHAGKHLGVEKCGIHPSGQNSFRSKLEALLKCNGPVYLIDADWWAIQDASLPIPSGNVVYAPPSFGIEYHFKETAVPKGGVFCSCLIGLDMSSKRIRGAVERAVSLLDAAPLYEQVFDEKFLNIAFYEDQKINVALLSTYWNWCDNELPKNAVGCHAALAKGPEEKLKFLLNAKFIN